jgi:tetratricopeptide (TPR) repeat protein
VDNAIKFTDYGEVLVRFYQSDAQHWVIQVADTGSGIPQNVQAHFNRGLAHQTLGNLEKAVQDFKRVVEIKPDYAKAYLNRGKALRALQRFKEALADFKTGARLGDLDAQAILDSVGISWKS